MVVRSHRPLILGLALSLGACSDSDSNSKDFAASDGASAGTDGGSTSGSAGADGDPSGTEGAATEDGAEESSGGVLLDVPEGQTGTSGDGEAGCGAVDFLFVIDNSPSMLDKQQNLIASFPGFIAALRANVDAADDVHAMVVKTDEPWVGACDLTCDLLGQCTHVPDWRCGSEQVAACDETLGAGVSNPLGQGSSNQDCQLVDGRRFVTGDEPDFATAFQCVASVGISGSITERPADALLAALEEEINGPGGCNEGFLRDDALLVVTIITDEEDNASAGTPQAWVDQVEALKAGAGPDGQGVVVLGLLADPAQDPGDECSQTSLDPVNLRSFVEGFPNHFLGSVCADDYSVLLGQAISLIETSCAEFVPPAG